MSAAIKLRLSQKWTCPGCVLMDSRSGNRIFCPSMSGTAADDRSLPSRSHSACQSLRPEPRQGDEDNSGQSRLSVSTGLRSTIVRCQNESTPESAFTPTPDCSPASRTLTTGWTVAALKTAQLSTFDKCQIITYRRIVFGLRELLAHKP